jgi:signal transduction histidine kinase
LATTLEGAVLNDVPRARSYDWLKLVDLVVAVASAVIVVIALVGAPHAGHRALWIVCGVVVLCWSGAAVAMIDTAPRLGSFLGVIALMSATAMIAMRLGEVSGHGTHGTAREVAVVATLGAMAVALHLLLGLPDGLLVARPRQLGAIGFYVIALALAVCLLAASRALSPWPVTGVFALAIAMTLPGVHTRYVAALAAGRQLIQSLAIGALVAIMVVVFIATVHTLLAWPPDPAPTLIAASGLIPLSMAIGSRPFASHADRVLVHLLTTFGFVVIVAAAYSIALRGLGKTPTTHNEREILAWSMAAAGIAAAMYVAARGRFARMATSLTYGAREAPDEVVRSFGTRLTRAIPMDELLLQLAESLRKTLGLVSAEIYTGTGEVLDLVVAVPDVVGRSLVVSGNERPVVARAGVSGNAWASVWIPGVLTDRPAGPIRIAPISHAGELLGIIVVSRGEGALAFREEDDRVLTDLARQVGLALHNAQLDTALQSSLDELRRQADELRASRARVVASGDAERRRVERNLHDGAQQHLVALAVNLRLAKDIVVEDPPGAVEMLDELGRAVQETIRELRELAHGIYPPLLVDSGLAEALKAVANRSPLDVELVTDGIARHGGDIEAAIYFCCLEALQNAGKHAPDSHVVIRIWEESGGLLFEVSDDGPGFDVGRAIRGHGYTNMADRLGAIGGAVRWESQPGSGTTIRGSVPPD